jgi:hypothetical protein
MKKSVENIRSAITKAEAGNLFGDAENELIDACIEFLKEEGFRVIEPSNYTYNKIKKVDDLIELFYILHKKYHPSNVAVYRPKLAVDRKTAKRFLESRMESSGLSKKFALRECAEIISVIFEFEEKFKFDSPINFSILGQAKLGWVTEKAIYLLNNRENLRRKRNDKAVQEKLEVMYDSEPDEDIGYPNLAETLERIKQHP